MKKNFFKFSLTLNIAFAIVAVIFTLIFYFSATRIDEGEVFLDFLYYVKTFFDLLAVFVGYTTIIYAFSQFDFKNGVIAIGTFSISFLISFLFQVFGACIDNPETFTADFLVYVIYYSFGQSFITQMIPALLIAFLTCWLTKNGTQKFKKFFSWANSIQKTMIIVTIFVFALNLISLTGFTVLPGLIPELVDYGSVTAEHLKAIVVSYVEIVIFYLVMQYLVYFFAYKIFHSHVISHSKEDSKEIL